MLHFSSLRNLRTIIAHHFLRRLHVFGDAADIHGETVNLVLNGQTLIQILLKIYLDLLDIRGLQHIRLLLKFSSLTIWHQMEVHKVRKILVLFETRDELLILNLLTHHDVVEELKGLLGEPFLQELGVHTALAPHEQHQVPVVHVFSHQLLHEQGLELARPHVHKQLAPQVSVDKALLLEDLQIDGCLFEHRPDLGSPFEGDLPAQEVELSLLLIHNEQLHRVADLLQLAHQHLQDRCLSGQEQELLVLLVDQYAFDTHTLVEAQQTGLQQGHKQLGV